MNPTRFGKGLLAIVLLAAAEAGASDHLDTPAVIADPRADIGDVYAWTSHDGRQLNLVMTIVGKTFSDSIDYVLHVDSGERFGRTTATTSITCRFPAANLAECRLGDVDWARGDARSAAGLLGRNHRFRVFAGLRDDPFFNNVKGTRAAYQTAADALRRGAGVDAAGCPTFDPATSREILSQWRHTNGGPATNFLAGWTVSAIVISAELDAVNEGGNLLAVWGATVAGGRQLDRAGRPLTGNALLGTFASAQVSHALKEQYNAATPATSGRFISEIEKGLALYDGFDGRCGNQLLADRKAAPSERYRPLATLLADDRLWVDSSHAKCSDFLAVELTSLAGRARRGDCGGRTPTCDASNIYRSLLVDGTADSVDDGVHRDDHQHSVTEFPFLAAPDTGPAGR